MISIMHINVNTGKRILSIFDSGCIRLNIPDVRQTKQRKYMDIVIINSQDIEKPFFFTDDVCSFFISGERLLAFLAGLLKYSLILII